MTDTSTSSSSDEQYQIPQRTNEIDPNRLEEKQILDRIQLSKYDNLVEDDDYYLLSMTWYKQWDAYLRNTRYPRPTKIDNSRLVDREGNLKATISERFDYMLVSKEIWDSLTEKYPASIELTAPCKKSSLGKLFVEVKKLSVKIKRSSEMDTTYTVSISKVCSLQEFLDLVVREFKISREDIRFWLFSGGRKYKRLKILTKKLDELGIYSGQTLLVEERKENGLWPSTSFYKKAANSNHSRFYSSPTEPGKTGLSNLGNTCFMNSALQCLSSVAPLTDFFLSGDYKKDLNPSNPLSTGGLLVEEYKKVVQGIWSPKTGVVEPSDFKRVLSKFADQFSGYNQHDSQELLIYLLDKIHEDINRVDQKPYVESKESDGREDSLVAKEAWEGHKLRDDSKVVDLFHGQLKSTVTCPDCGKKSITFDPFMYLSVPVPGRTTSTERNVEIILFRQDTTIAPMKFKIKASDYDQILTLKEQLCKLQKDLPDPDRLTFFDVYENYFYNVFQDERRIREILPNDVVYAFEHCAVEEVDSDDEDSDDSIENTEKDIRVIIYHLLEDEDDEFYGTPMLLSIKNNYTYDQLREKFVEFLKPYLKETPANTSLFEMIPMNLKGNKYRYELKRGEILWTEEASCFGLVWSEENFKKFYNTDRDTKFVEHECCIDRTEKTKIGTDLADCLTAFTKEEQLGRMDTWYCNVCKDHMQAFKKLDLWSLPPVLIIHLKRFSEVGGMWRSKLDTKIDYPIENLDLSEFMLQSDDNNIYDLIAVSNHFGSMGGGHYTAYMQHRNGGWYECDDSSVSPLHSSPVTSSGYVLFYKRRDFAFEPFNVEEELQQPVDEESSSESGSEDSGSPTFIETEPERTHRFNSFLPSEDESSSSSSTSLL